MNAKRLLAAACDSVVKSLQQRNLRRSNPAQIDALETRRLFATLVVNGGSGDDTCTLEVTGGFINANMNGFNIPQPVGLWDDVQINLFEGDDVVEIRNTGDEPVNISLGSGTDLVKITPTTNNLDSISSRVSISAGSDGLDDHVEVSDTGDSGDDAYTILEDGPMKLRKGTADKLFWGESNLNVAILLNEGNNTVTVNSSVSMIGSDEFLTVGGLGSSFGGGNDTVNFNGVIGGDNIFRFNGGTGSDVLNVTGTSFQGSDGQIFMDGGASVGDTLNITDSGPADTYLFAGNRDTISLLANTALGGEYKYTGTEAINLSATAAGIADTFDIQELGANLSIDGGDDDDSFRVGDGSIDTAEFGTGVDIVIDGGAGVDDVTISDSSATVGRTHTFGGLVYDHPNIGTLDMTSISTAVLNCGSGADTIDVNFRPGPTATLTVNGNGGADAFEVTPDFTAAIHLNGGTPGTSPGDVLTLDVGTLTGGIFTPAGVGAGSYDFPVRDVINFTGMENFPAAPAAPGAADLSAADDTGISSTDNITNDTSLNFSGTGAGASSQVQLFRDGTSIATATATAGGAYSFANAAFATGDATFAMTVRYSSTTTGLLSNASAPLNVHVDTVAPANPTVAPDLDASSDLGTSSTDNITRDNTPTFIGATPGNQIVRLLSSGVEVGFVQVPVTGTSYTVTSSALADGSRIMTTRFEDLAGNASAGVSPTRVVTIDTVAPQLNNSAFNFLKSQNVVFGFNENLGAGIDLGDVTLRDVTHNSTIPNGSLFLNYVPNNAIITFPGFAGSILTDADWEMTVSSDVTDIAGNHFAGTTFPFFFLNGDANHDRRVNANDFAILASNFGQSNRNFAQADFNYDGRVNANDFAILASHFGATLAAQTAEGQPGISPRFNGDSLIEQLLA